MIVAVSEMTFLVLLGLLLAAFAWWKLRRPRASVSFPPIATVRRGFAGMNPPTEPEEEEGTIEDLAWLTRIGGVETVFLEPGSRTVFVIANGNVRGEARLWLERIVRQSTPIGFTSRVVARNEVPVQSLEINAPAASRELQ
jgi:hypothetical protein